MQQLNNQGQFCCLFYYSKQKTLRLFNEISFLIKLIVFNFNNLTACEKSFKIRKSWEKAAKKLERQEVNMKLGAVNIDDSKFFF